MLVSWKYLHFLLLLTPDPVMVDTNQGPVNAVRWDTLLFAVVYPFPNTILTQKCILSES